MKISSEIDVGGFTEHYQSDGVYLRVLNIKAGNIVVGAKHLTTHLSVVLEGEISISINGDVRRMKAPYIFEAITNSRKVAYAHTDVKIMNIIPTHLETIEEITEMVVDKTMPNDMNILKENLRRLV